MRIREDVLEKSVLRIERGLENTVTCRLQGHQGAVPGHGLELLAGSFSYRACNEWLRNRTKRGLAGGAQRNTL